MNQATTVDRFWLRSYPQGVPEDIDPGAYASLVALFEEVVAEFPERPAFSNLGVSITFAELDASSRAFAAYLRAGLGLQPGDRVALMMPNLLQYPVALFGVLRAGLAAVSVNPLYTARELRHQLADSEAAAIVVLENFAHVFEQCAGDVPVRHAIVTRMGDLLGAKGWLVNAVVKYVKRMVPPFRVPGAVAFRDALRQGETLALPAVEIGPDDLAFLQYTGGTTGVAKGAMLTHGNMVANVEQASAWIAPRVERGGELIVTALPLYHIFALTANCLVYMRSGGLNLLVTNPRDMKGFVKLLQGVRFTAITGVNTLFNGLLNTPGFDALDFSALKISLGGGMAVQSVVAERWKETTRCPLLEAYGLTETSPAVCINPVDLEDFNGAIGLPLPSTEVCIRDDDGRELPRGEAGELCVRGPQVMRGYWNRPEETSLCIDADGWLRTGDVATIDDAGFVRIVDRKKDVIIVSGFNVYPNEIEAVVAAHPGILEAGAIGVPDAECGEAVKVVVVRRDATLEADAVNGWCAENLTGYKRPKHVEFVEELPKSNVGKILRRELRDRYGEPD